jgi:protein TonB
MKAMIISILTLSSFTTLNAQEDEKVFEKIEVNATTDQKKWNDHINIKTQLPDSAIKDIPPGTYKVNVQFIVDVHGNMGQIKALNDPGYGLTKRALNAVSSYKGEWKPANQCGRNVNAYRKQSIVFIVPAQ